MIGRTPVAAETCDSHVCAHAVRDHGVEAVRDLEVQHRDEVAGRDRRIPEEPARLVARVVERQIRVGEVVRPDSEAGGPRPRAVRPIRRIRGQRPRGRTNERESLARGRDLRPVDHPLVVAHVDAVDVGRVSESGSAGRRSRGRGFRGLRPASGLRPGGRCQEEDGDGHGEKPRECSVHRDMLAGMANRVKRRLQYLWPDHRLSPGRHRRSGSASRYRCRPSVASRMPP